MERKENTMLKTTQQNAKTKLYTNQIQREQNKDYLVPYIIFICV